MALMILLKKNGFNLNNQKYYSKVPLFSESLTTDFINCTYKEEKFGFMTVINYTKIIDLTKTNEEIVSGFAKNTQYEIRRAQNENLEVKFNYLDYDFFVKFYNSFAARKGGIKSNYKSSLYSRNSNIFILNACTLDERILVLHSYLIDKDCGKVILFQSASAFRDQDAQSRSLIGRANRFLHYRDITYFKSLGYATYDFGGYAFETSNPILININSFKDSFGGELVQFNSFISYFRLLLKKLLV